MKINLCIYKYETRAAKNNEKIKHNLHYERL